MPYIDPTVTCDEVGWITPADLCCASPDPDQTVDCNGDVQPVVQNWTDEQLIKAASDILYARTCYRYPGVCTRTVWPCLSCGCACNNPCGCGIYDAIELTSDYPILGVTEVQINGVVVPDDQYRLDENARIVRIDGEMWPTSNNLGLTNTPGYCQEEVRVTYTTGREVPQALKMAAAELACQLKKACSGDNSCELPAHVRSVSRRGVEYDMNDFMKLLQHGLFGNPTIDLAVQTYGKCGKASLVDFTRGRKDVRIS